EINTPLAYVITNLVVLRRDMQAALAALEAYRQGRTADAARLEEEADVVYFQQHFARTCDKTLEGLQRVRDIVQNLRDFAHLDEAEFKEADLNAALAAALEILGHAAKQKDVRLETHFEPLPPVLGPAGKLNQVFRDRLERGVEAGDRGGTVTARTRVEGGSEIVVEVQDTGCGIAAEHQARLFEPFFTTKPVGQGTGLGLSVSFGII